MSNPTDTVREALLPCPFCGKDKPNISYKHIDITPGERVGTIWDVTCWNCGAEKARYDSEEHAIAAWNTRAALEAQLAREPVSIADMYRICAEAYINAEQSCTSCEDAEQQAIIALLDHLGIPHDGQTNPALGGAKEG